MLPRKQWAVVGAQLAIPALVFMAFACATVIFRAYVGYEERELMKYEWGWGVSNAAVLGVASVLAVLLLLPTAAGRDR
jgi:hypothetical protein